MSIKYKNFKFCFPILENDVKSFINKIKSIKYDNNYFYELRIDYLLESHISIDEIIDMINYVKKYMTKNKLIVTIRTKIDGGKFQIDKNKYFNYIEKLFILSRADYIDVEYELFKKNNQKFNNLFKNSNKKIIISKHIFDKEYSGMYKKVWTEMSKIKCDIVKFAISINDYKNLIKFLIDANEISKKIIKIDKSCIFIAMGIKGQISRIWPELTNTSIVFLNAYEENQSKIGQICYNEYQKYRNILEKTLKN